MGGHDGDLRQEVGGLVYVDRCLEQIQLGGQTKTWGTRSVSIETMITCSCRTWLCSTLARRASGVVCGFALRNTAVPGTRATGNSRASSLSMKSRSGPS